MTIVGLLHKTETGLQNSGNVWDTSEDVEVSNKRVEQIKTLRFCWLGLVTGLVTSNKFRNKPGFSNSS